MRNLSRVTSVLVSIGAAGAMLLGGAAPASATSQAQMGNCNNNYDVSPVAYTLVDRAPKVWSQNGHAQAVRYRSVLDKWNGAKFAWVATGVWHYGTAYPSTYWQGPSGTWDTRSHGAGYYSSRTQVQYSVSGVYGGTDTARINSYYLMYKQFGGWTNMGTVAYCRVY